MHVNTQKPDMHVATKRMHVNTQKPDMHVATKRVATKRYCMTASQPDMHVATLSPSPSPSRGILFLSLSLSRWAFCAHVMTHDVHRSHYQLSCCPLCPRRPSQIGAPPIGIFRAATLRASGLGQGALYVASADTTCAIALNGAPSVFNQGACLCARGPLGRDP